MPSLVINAPKRQENSTNAKSFEEIVRTGVGCSYAICERLFEKIEPGCKVVLLSKDQKLRAEGELVELVLKDKTMNGIQRYDVRVRSFRKVVHYEGERLERCGVAWIE